jgi:hypothetical protein
LGDRFLCILDKMINNQEHPIGDPNATGNPCAEQRMNDGGDGIEDPDDSDEEEEDPTPEQEDRMPDTAIIDIDPQPQGRSTREERMSSTWLYISALDTLSRQPQT